MDFSELILRLIRLNITPPGLPKQRIKYRVVGTLVHVGADVAAGEFVSIVWTGLDREAGQNDYSLIADVPGPVTRGRLVNLYKGLPPTAFPLVIILANEDAGPNFPAKPLGKGVKRRGLYSKRI